MFGLASVLWGALSLFASQHFPDWLGVPTDKGAAFIDFHSINTGLWPGLGLFALAGVAIERLRKSATLTLLVCTASIAGGRVIALALGGQAGVRSSITLALEFAMVAAFSVAYVSEKSRLAREARAKLDKPGEPEAKTGEPAAPSAMQR